MMAEDAHHNPTAQPAGRFPWTATILALVMGAVLLLGLRTGGKIIRSEWYPFVVWMAVPGVLACLLWRRMGARRGIALRRYAPLLVLALVLLLYLVSSIALHKWFFFLSWAPGATPVARSGLGRFALWTSLLTLFFAWRPCRPWLIPLAILVGAELLSIGALLEETGGAALYRTDHPSFMFRLWEFTRNFPDLVTYMPHWNAGVLHYVSVTSGTSGPGLVLWPLLRFFPVHQVYTPAWAMLFLVVVPWVAVGSVRAMGGDRTAAFTGGILALGVSQHFFLWALHFGTIGAAFASAMALPVSALAFRAVWMRRRERWLAVCLVLAGLLLLTWPPAGLAGVGVGIAALAGVNRRTLRSWPFLALCGAAVVLLFTPWLRVILGEGKGVVEFVLKSGKSGADAPSFTSANLVSGLKHLAAHLQEINPLIVCFGIAGVVTGASRRLRRWFLPILIVLALVTGWARELKPHSQLSRMSIPLAFVAVGPAAIFIGRLLRANDLRLAAVRAGLTALLMLSGYNVAKICANRGLARYVVLDDERMALPNWIREHTPENGRVLFAGKCVHGYGGGNVAYLPVLTGREMMAVDYYGFPPEQVLYEYPPREFRKTPEQVWTFFEAYNVSHIVTYHGKWKKYFDDQPDRYTERVELGPVSIYERRAPVGMIHGGGGRVTAGFDRLDVELDDPSTEVMLAYNWLDGLEVDPPVEIRPREFVNGIALIGVQPNGRQSFAIRFRR